MFKGNRILSGLIVLIFAGSGIMADSRDKRSLISTNRPMRDRRHMVLAVGQSEGDLQGKDDKVIQAGIEYLYRFGGGTLRISPGVYLLQNAIHLRSNITLRGSGEKTILKKTASTVTKLARDSDWFEYGVQVKNVKGFVPGGGIMLRTKTGPGAWQYKVLRSTITAVEGDVLFLDRLTEENFWLEKDATAATIFPILTAEHVDNVVVENLVLDGNREHNEHINGNFAGAVFIQHCNKWSFKSVTARNYNGDGFSFQVCDDIRFQDCQAINNTDLGFHPGSGSQRPVFQRCISRGNSQGIFFCWSVSDGLAENCTLSNNKRYGISIGHRDTDNVIRACTIENNDHVGILFRKTASDFRSGHRNRIENCLIRNNGQDGKGIGIDIQGKTSDITVQNTRFVNTIEGNQKQSIRVSEEAERIVLRNNTYEGCSPLTEKSL